MRKPTQKELRLAQKSVAEAIEMLGGQRALCKKIGKCRSYIGQVLQGQYFASIEASILLEKLTKIPAENFNPIIKDLRKII